MKRSSPYAAQSLTDFERVTLGVYYAREGSTLAVRASANLNRQNAPVMRRAVVDAIAEGVTNVTIDLRHCPRIDRNGLTELASIAGETRRAGGVVTITHASDEIRLLFRLKGIDRLFTIAQDRSSTTSPTSPA